MRLKAKLAREWGIKTFPNAGNSEEYIAMEAFVAGFEMAKAMAAQFLENYDTSYWSVPYNDAYTDRVSEIFSIGEEDVDET